MSQVPIPDGRSVTMIPQRVRPFTRAPIGLPVKKKVAAYARVSTDDEEQQTSYEAQVDYYTQYILRNPDWEFVEVYADEGITGTNLKHRQQFKRMIADALDGKIDLIVTKSISRFARNTVDSLVTVRQLKEKGVEVYFEKENIYTLDSKGELLITIMSSLAQEESRSISENVTWGQRKRFADGKVSLPYKQFLGYEKGENGRPKIVEKEARIVRLIYKWFMDGQTVNGVAKALTEQGIPTPSGKRLWQGSTVESILTNEKYKGDALLQKCYTVDFLTKEKRVNNGEVPQYYVKNSHPAIIEPDVFDMVQSELAKRKQNARSRRAGTVFTGRIVCADCGCFYGRKTWHSTSKYKRYVWQCNRKYDGEEKRRTPHLYENELKEGFVRAFNQLVGDKDELVQELSVIIEGLTDTDSLEADRRRAADEAQLLTEAMERLVAENARVAMDQDDYLQRYGELAAKRDAQEAALKKLDVGIQERRARKAKLELFIGTLDNGLMIEFDEEVWCAMIESVKVRVDGRVTYRFIDGTEI